MNKNEHLRTGENIVCPCGQSFYVQSYLLKSGRKKYCSKKCFFEYRESKALFTLGHEKTGEGHNRPHSQQTKDRISEIQREKNKDKVKDLIKEQERDWKKKIRHSFHWKDWRKAIFERDDYTCQECSTRGGKLEPHHIIPIREDLDQLFNIKNGITLCRECHMKTFRRENLFVEKYSAIVSQKQQLLQQNFG